MTEQNLEVSKLSHGSHKSRDEGMCLLEATAYLAGEPHSDHPECADPVLGAFGRAVNDMLTDEERQALVPFERKLIGTRGDHTLSLRRAMLLCDGVVRQILPIAMDGIGLTAEAEKLRALSTVDSESAAESAESAAWSAESAAWSAARSAAESAWSARSAAESAAESAAWSARSARSARSAAESAESAESAWSARSAAESAESAAWSAESAAWSAARSARSGRKSVVEALIKIFDAAVELR